jgi:hypothetical protein
VIQTIFKQVFGAAGSQSGALSNQDCNGLIVYSSVTFTSTDFLTVLLKSSKHESKVLVNRVSCQGLAELSDAEYGQSPALQAELEVLSASDYLGHALVVPLGCLRNRANDSSLEVLLEVGQACTASVAAFYNKSESDHYVATLESRQLSDRADDIDSLWIYNPTATLTPHTLDLSVLVKSAYGSTIANAMDVFGFTAAFKQVEAFAPKRVACIFDAADKVHDAVSWVISGTDSASFRIIARSVGRDDGRVSRGSVSEVSRMLGILKRKPSAALKAFKRSGIVDVDEVNHASQVYNVPQQ